MPEKKIVSWNVNGIRAMVKKGFIENIRSMDPYIICLQETKASNEEVKKALVSLSEYEIYVNDSKLKKGYSGTAILTKETPSGVTYDIGLTKHNQEGRVITAEYPQFFLTVVYTPNAGQELIRLDYREDWDREFLHYMRWLNKRKPVVLCGDLNVAHTALDIARPKENYNKSAGYTQREIDGFEKLLNAGFIDTFRHRYPDKIAYTYWSYIANARKKNIGWRIDYFLVTQKLLSKVRDASVYNEFSGSDHCPVALHLKD